MRYLTIGRLSAKSHLVTWGYVTATRLGVEPQVILQMIVRGEMPLLGIEQAARYWEACLPIQDNLTLDVSSELLNGSGPPAPLVPNKLSKNVASGDGFRRPFAKLP